MAVDKNICKITLKNQKPLDLYVCGKAYHLQDEITVNMNE